MSKQKKLKPIDFSPETFEGEVLCFSFKNKKFIIRLESCLNGFDVAIYDWKNDLLAGKICTNLSGFSLHAIDEAVKIANHFYQQFNS